MKSPHKGLFQSISAAFGCSGVTWSGNQGVNSLERQEYGLFIVNHKRDSTPNAKVISVLRGKAQKRVWDHTQVVLGLYL